MKQSELKWVYNVGTLTPKSVSEIGPITDYCIKLNEQLYLPQGTSKNTRVGFKYFVNSITFNFTYGNANSSNGISGKIALIHIKDKFTNGIYNNTATALSSQAMNFQNTPLGWTKEYPKLGYYSIKQYVQTVELANSTTVGVSFDQGQKRTAQWTLRIPINKEIKLSEESNKGIELLNQYLWIMYYTSPFSLTVGTVPDVKYNYYFTFYDL